MKHFGINLHHFKSFSISLLLLYPTPEKFTGFVNHQFAYAVTFIINVHNCIIALSSDVFLHAYYSFLCCLLSSSPSFFLPLDFQLSLSFSHSLCFFVVILISLPLSRYLPHFPFCLAISIYYINSRQLSLYRFRVQ